MDRLVDTVQNQRLKSAPLRGHGHSMDTHTREQCLLWPSRFPWRPAGERHAATRGTCAGAPKPHTGTRCPFSESFLTWACLFALLNFWGSRRRGQAQMKKKQNFSAKCLKHRTPRVTGVFDKGDWHTSAEAPSAFGRFHCPQRRQHRLWLPPRASAPLG